MHRGCETQTTGTNLLIDLLAAAAECVVLGRDRESCTVISPFTTAYT